MNDTFTPAEERDICRHVEVHFNREVLAIKVDFNLPAGAAVCG
jgi:hypothetical protein